jgi:oligogalacturonide lyase
MPKGTIFPSEATETRDSKTNVLIRRITSHSSHHHHPFYYVPAYDDQMRWLFFASHRTGSPQFFAERRETGQLVQLTDREDLNEWSFHPSHDGRFLFFTTESGGWRLNMESLREEQLVDFEGGKKAAGMVGAGMVGAGMGTTTLSHDDKWWAIPVCRGSGAKLLSVNTETGEATVVCENEVIGHPQFHPNDSCLLRYGGPFHRRIWVTERNGDNHHLAYQRNDAAKEWIVHECWRPGTREILTTNWPHGVIAIDVDTTAWRWVARFNAWHPMVDPKGERMVTDTKNPDTGLQIFDISDPVASPNLLCESLSSNVGEHWNTDHCPYDDGPVDVFAPQHTHPHPNFSPDGRLVLFTSDRTGNAQLYEASV